ncbi:MULTISPECIES: type IV pilus biogenesis protein PilM [Enterobacteriaceae]|uniref:type IV pilus biogenesis protein PilM n=1 Tax=Enterobacteriaceae TaxID=543 RepID=UPI002B28C6F5|nr:type IV pilus biogenesis protein PilM [Citrobacter braakii]
MKSMLIVAFFTLLVAFYQNSDDSKESYNESLRTNKASLFLNYTSAFDTYYLTHSSANGDVTSQVTLPTWLPVDTTVKMNVSGGYGYVYMPSISGVLSEVMKATDNSALVGISDNTVIKTNSGTIAKPTFIPAGYIVYVR